MRALGLVIALLLTTGCITTARIAKLENAIARIDNHIVIGGDGDSITTWILAVGLILSPLVGGWFYQYVLRPRRKRKEKHD